jgi:hypothetical protein
VLSLGMCGRAIEDSRLARTRWAVLEAAGRRGNCHKGKPRCSSSARTTVLNARKTLQGCRQSKKKRRRSDELLMKITMTASEWTMHEETARAAPCPKIASAAEDGRVSGFDIKTRQSLIFGLRPRCSTGVRSPRRLQTRHVTTHARTCNHTTLQPQPVH